MSRYGWLPSLPDHRDIRSDISGLALPPTTVDPRHRFPWGRQDQLNLGSCTANAANRAVQIHYLFGKDTVLPNLSRLFTYYEERLREGTLNQGDCGAMGRDGFWVAKNLGIPPETDWPYKVTAFAARPPDVAYSDPNRAVIERYTHPNPDWTTFTTVLAHHQPIIFGFTVYESFESEEVARTGVVPMPKPTESVLGGHEVVAIGYKPGYFLCENSWGPDWGEEGFFWMPAAYLLSRSYCGDYRTIPRRA